MEIRRIPLIFSFILFASGTSNLLVNEYFDKTVADAETFLSQSDFDRARLRIRAKRNTDVEEEEDESAMFNSERFEGDIANPGLTSKNIRIFVGDEPAKSVSGQPGVQHNAIRSPYLRWPSGRVPYTISTQFSTIGRQRIAEVFEEFTAKTCIRFEPKTASDHDYIHIIVDDGCYSMVGKTGGEQILSLGKGCMWKGIIIHELMHAIGFFHEQSRADRDDYVTIKYENMENGGRDQFDKYSLSTIDHLGTKYDYESIMHYPKTAFSKNGNPTIVPKQAGVSFGQRKGFSSTDVFKINKLYSCLSNSVRIENTDMSDPMQHEAINCATRALDKYKYYHEMAMYIKNEFEKKYKPTWHCIVGSNFESYVARVPGHYVYFVIGDISILLFKSH